MERSSCSLGLCKKIGCKELLLTVRLKIQNSMLYKAIKIQGPKTIRLGDPMGLTIFHDCRRQLDPSIPPPSVVMHLGAGAIIKVLT